MSSVDPAVTVAVPVLNEALHIEECLSAVERQTYHNVVEILVVDGGSTDETRQLAEKHPLVRIIDNPRRIQAAALNLALGEAVGDVFVRVDGHCVIADDYVECCVEALEVSGAALVGGAMHPIGESPLQRGIAMAMSSPFGAGPARFHVGGAAGWVDTVYLGAAWTAALRRAGGYNEHVGVNEDAELAHRMGRGDGVWFDPGIQSSYVPRDSLRGLARQFWTYGTSRARTVRLHPESLSLRQLAAPALVLSTLSPWRRRALGAYLLLLIGVGARHARRDATGAALGVLVMPVMHFSWGAAFIVAILRAMRDS